MKKLILFTTLTTLLGNYLIAEDFHDVTKKIWSELSTIRGLDELDDQDKKLFEKKINEASNKDSAYHAVRQATELQYAKTFAPAHLDTLRAKILNAKNQIDLFQIRKEIDRLFTQSL